MRTIIAGLVLMIAMNTAVALAQSEGRASSRDHWVPYPMTTPWQLWAYVEAGNGEFHGATGLSWPDGR